MSKDIHETLIHTSSSASEDECIEVAKTSSKQRSRSIAEPKPGPSRAKKHIQPVTSRKPLSAYDLFGTDSEDEETQHVTPPHPSTSLTNRKHTSASHEKKLKHVNRSHSSHRVEETNTPIEKSAKKRKSTPIPSTSRAALTSSPAPPPASRSTTSPKRKHTEAREPARFKRSTAHDMFGSDVDSDGGISSDKARPGKQPAPLNSYIHRKLINGIARQTYDKKHGSYYVELKVYNCNDIERVQPMNRWRHAVVTIKNRTNDDTDAWRSLTSFIAATRQEFQNCPPTFIPQ